MNAENKLKQQTTTTTIICIALRHITFPSAQTDRHLYTFIHLRYTHVARVLFCHVTDSQYFVMSFAESTTRFRVTTIEKWFCFTSHYYYFLLYFGEICYELRKHLHRLCVCLVLLTHLFFLLSIECHLFFLVRLYFVDICFNYYLSIGFNWNDELGEKCCSHSTP